MASKKAAQPVESAGRDVRTFSTRLPRDLVKRMRRYAVDNEVKLQLAVAEALEEYLAKRKS